MDASNLGWTWYYYKSLMKISMYTSGKFIEIKIRKSSTELEILGMINYLNSFNLYIQNDAFTIDQILIIF